MICKLTGKEGSSIKAHIIPEKFYLIDPNDKRPQILVTDTKGVFPKKSWKGVYDKTIVTKDGEEFFLTLDDYAGKLLVEQFHAKVPIIINNKLLGFRLDCYDYKLLKLFFISLLWRAGVSSQPFFKNVKLGPHEENLKNAILNSEPGDSDFYSVLLAVYDFEENVSKIMDPFPSKFDGIRYYTFYLGNFIAYIKVDKQKAVSPFRELQLTPEKPLYIVLRKFWESKESQIMKQLVKRMPSK